VLRNDLQDQVGRALQALAAQEPLSLPAHHQEVRLGRPQRVQAHGKAGAAHDPIAALVEEAAPQGQNEKIL
jgi:hypothetical protein